LLDSVSNFVPVASTSLNWSNVCNRSYNITWTKMPFHFIWCLWIRAS
jgi:hypothetical protein